jgi:hypothetical protein
VPTATNPATTRDHLPPQGLFAKGMPNKPWVPSCLDCNRGASKDDEYMQRLAMLCGADRAVTPGVSKSGSCVRSNGRKRRVSRAKFAETKYRGRSCAHEWWERIPAPPEPRQTDEAA